MRKIDGLIRKIKGNSLSEIFYDFEFWGENDDSSYGIVCLTRIKQSNELYIIELLPAELKIKDFEVALSMVKDRVSHETGYSDFVDLSVIRFTEKKINASSGFQSFLADYEKPVPVYRNIFSNGTEAVQIEKLTINEFLNKGGVIKLLGELELVIDS